jgi:hypothetical protein
MRSQLAVSLDIASCSLGCLVVQGFDSLIRLPTPTAGIESAAAAGIYTVGVTTSRDANEVIGMGASIAVADFEDAALLAAVRQALD